MPRKTTTQRKLPRENALERDPRFEAFQEFYVELRGNAYRAAIQAGYTEAYAKSHAHLLASRLRLKANPVLRRFSLDEVFVARKLKRLAGAKMPKWNRSKVIKAAVLDPQDPKKVLVPEVRGGFQLFEDGSTQLRAIELVADLLEMKPAVKLKGDGPDGALVVVVKSSIPRPQHAARS